MDSKLRNTAIVLMLFMMAAVCGVVFYLNQEKINSKTTAVVTEAGQETTEALVSGNELAGENVTVSQATGTVYGAEGTQVGNDLSAFLQDETFFDAPEKKTVTSSDNETKLSLVVTSVEKDLRIKVVNALGDLVTGQRFAVTLRDNGEYQDLDRDGNIVINDLSAGDYYVSLEEIEGYEVPASGVRARVKDKVEFTVINDIDSIIKKESEVDATVEDTEVNGAGQEADGSEIKDLRDSDATKKLGIDVSKWNKDIEWNKVKASGVDYVIIRCGYRGASTGALIEDPYFEQNIKGATEAGLKVGLYFFTQATTEVEAVEEASMVMCLLGDNKIDYPVFIDTEGAGGSGRADNLDRDMRTAVCSAFCETITNSGYTAGVYASANWFRKNVDASSLEDYVIWLAEYKNEASYEGTYDMWQYTSSGDVNGIDGRVDLNLSYLGY